jgi:hypothetical protein
LTKWTMPTAGFCIWQSQTAMAFLILAWSYIPCLQQLMTIGVDFYSDRALLFPHVYVTVTLHAFVNIIFFRATGYPRRSNWLAIPYPG